MARTGYIFIPWQEQVTFLYHGKNRLHFYTMARTGYILSAILWQEQVTFCQLYHGKNRLHFNEMMSAIPWQEQVTFQ